MKKLPVLICVLALWLVSGPAAHAQKIAAVNLKRVFDGYWKTKQADLNLKDRAAELDKKRKEMLDDYKKANDDYKTMLDQANDKAVSVEERDRRKENAEKKLREIQEIEQSVQQFDRSARAQLAEQQRNIRDKILAEIREVINNKARADGVAAVLDTAAEAITNTPIVLFSDGLTDLTDVILTQINASAPPGSLKP